MCAVFLWHFFLPLRYACSLQARASSRTDYWRVLYTTRSTIILVSESTYRARLLSYPLYCKINKSSPQLAPMHTTTTTTTTVVLRTFRPCEFRRNSVFPFVWPWITIVHHIRVKRNVGDNRSRHVRKRLAQNHRVSAGVTRGRGSHALRPFSGPR